MPRLLIAASGTGGHIFPALAVAEALPSGWEINWLGVPDRLETQLVPDHYELITIQVGGLQGNILQKFFKFLHLIAATKFVFSLIKKRDIEILFTTGGYIAAPAILAAKLSGKKIILHESNAFPGRVTRALGRFCDLVALGMPMASEHLLRCRTVETGTPVRKSFLSSQPLPDWVPIGQGPLVVIMGGSQGAVGLNRMVRFSFPFLLEQGCRVVHLTGENDKQYLDITHKNLVTKTYSNEIPALLQHAEIVISRAGASAISELAICGTPAVLVPYPAATDDHQSINALCAGAEGAAVIFHEQNSEHNSLNKVLARLLHDRLNRTNDSNNILKKMQQAMHTMAKRDAEQYLAQLLLTLV